jgi:hypothetical protein
VELFRDPTPDGAERNTRATRKDCERECVYLGRHNGGEARTLADLERRIANLVAAIADGGERTSLTSTLRQLETDSDVKWRSGKVAAGDRNKTHARAARHLRLGESGGGLNYLSG